MLRNQNPVIKVVMAALLASSSLLKADVMSLPQSYLDAKDYCLGTLASMTTRLSPNSSNRNKTKIDRIVLHDTGSPATRTFARATEYLRKTDDGREVSIHYLIGRDSNQLVSLVPESKAAWHAGPVKGVSMNSRSIGIELFRRDTVDTIYTDWQYRSLAELTYDIMYRYNLGLSSIITHAEWDPTRKHDPAGFDWARFDDELQAVETCVYDFTGTAVLNR